MNKSLILLAFIICLNATIKESIGELTPNEEKLAQTEVKVFDDPYLAAEEKDADVYDTTEKRLADVILPKKNHYKEVKKPTLYQRKVDGLEEEHRRKMFKEWATFNYGIIGVLKKQLEDSMEQVEEKRPADILTERSGSGEEQGQQERENGRMWTDGGGKVEEDDDVYGLKQLNTEPEEDKQPDLDTVGWFE